MQFNLALSLLITSISFSSPAFAEEVDSDNDGVIDSLDVDIDGDGLIEISTLAEFDNIRNNLTGSAYNDGSGDNSNGCGNNEDVIACFGYELTNDLDFDENGNGDLEDDSYYNDGAGFTPLTERGPSYFSATLDGNGHNISNLVINMDSDDVGLFRQIRGATFKNLNIVNAFVVGKSNSGILAARDTYSEINTFDNLNISGRLVGDNYLGAIAGRISASATVNEVNVNVDISPTVATYDHVGGFFAYSGNIVTITQSTFSGELTGDAYVAGFIAVSDETYIYDSYANVDIVATDDYIGGLIGDAQDDVIIERAFVTGSISGDRNVGGIIGEVSQPSSFSDVIVTASVSSGNYDGASGGHIGGIAGQLWSDLTLTNAIVTGPLVSAIADDETLGGLAGYSYSKTLITTAAYWDVEKTNVASNLNDTGQGYYSADLQCPTANDDTNCIADIYANWSSDNWDFGQNDQYPALIINSNLYRDADADGYYAFEDAFDNDASEYLDSDNDGVGDNTDAFPEDEFETVDTDSDGLGNNADLDDDNDGLTDEQELMYGLDPLNVADAFLDADADGIMNLDEIHQGTDINSADDYNIVFDPNFSGGVPTTHNFTDGSDDDYEFGYLYQDGNQFLVGGYYYDEPYDDDYIAVARFNSDASFDEAFATNGVYYGNSDDIGSYVYNITELNNGSYLMSLSYGTNGAAVVAIKKDGTLDTSAFSERSNTSIYKSLGNRSIAPVAYQTKNGDLYISSSYRGSANSRGYIEKASASGVRDTSFADGAGKYEFNFKGNFNVETGVNIFEQSSGNIMFVTRAGNTRYMLELTPDGILNTDFAVEGVLNLGSAKQVIQLTDGRYAVLYSGKVNDVNGLHVTIYSETGELDVEFGEQGYFTFASGELSINGLNLFAQDNGTFLIASTFSKSGNNGLQLVQVTSLGELDTQYNDVGFVRSFYNGDSDFKQAVKLDNHNVVFAGDDDSQDVPLASVIIMTNDYDADLDGYPDSIDTFPNDATENADTDNDGTGDNADAFPSDPTETMDSDNDGVGDNTDAFPNDGDETLDTDGDGIGNNADTDDDGDGVNDNEDPNPLTPGDVLNTAPQILVAEYQSSYDSGAVITLTAIGTDAQTSQLSYQWQQVSGLSLDFDSLTVSEISITLPEVDEDTVIELLVTVSDGELSAEQKISFTVLAQQQEESDEAEQVESDSSSSGGSMSWLLVCVLVLFRSKGLISIKQ
ncbi:hypothetical protein [Thalassotalea crassostreae]|uniref:hypothetical protein n=1 Tax=Thalassotalea crassostreae TaxID=1763536 RepID=UPI000839A466|nr:hypothetical protein [Thalassotalea crassostreae]